MTWSPAELARRHAPMCPACKNAPNRRAKCKCCAGAGVVGVAELEAAISGERERALDALYLVETAAREIRERFARGEVPTEDWVNPGGS